MIKLNCINNVLNSRVHYITSEYKLRNESRKEHNGIDLVGKNYKEDKVIAVNQGRIIKTGKDNSRGNYIEIFHNEVNTYYFHLKDSSIQVKVGDIVRKEQILGDMGATGNATGNHLHFAVSKNGTFIDPKPYLTTNNIFKTEKIKNLQSILNDTYKTNLIADGSLGPLTKNVLLKNYLRQGSKNNHVGFLQKELYRVGYDLKIDNSFGPDTLNKLKNFQSKYNLKVDGYAGSEVFLKLVEL